MFSLVGHSEVYFTLYIFQDITEITNVQSEDGYGFPAIQLFVIVIKYLKDKILKQLEGNVTR